MDLAALTAAELTILSVIDPLLAAAASETSGKRDALTSQTLRELHDLMARIGSTHPRPREPRTAVVVGHAADQILEQAAECHADLIVMGTQGLEGAKRFVFGSTTERVLRESRVPVLAVPLATEAD